MTFFVIAAWALLIASILAGEGYGFILARWEALAALLILTLFWLWNGASIFWSISADESWIEFSRTGGYLALFILGSYVGRSRPARKIAILLFPLAALPALLYGLGSKVFPENIENLVNAARINIPLGYVNAVGLLNALTLIFLLHIASSKSYHNAIRIAAAASLPVMLVSLFFTLSRGSTLALGIGIVALVCLSPQRQRIAGIIALALAPAALIIWWSSDKGPLMDDLVEATAKAPLASTLRLYLLGAFVAVALVFAVALLIGKRVSFPRYARTVTGYVLLASVVISILAAGGYLVQAKPSLTGWLRDAYDDFRTGTASEAGAGRLLSVGASQRYALWRESLDNWDEHFIGGTGAQTFPIVHLQKREDKDLFVKQPHGLPFRLLAELGIVGAALMAVFIPLTVAAAARLYCLVRDRWERGMAAALLVVMIVYLMHTGYDWDWNMFSLTGAYFFFTGTTLGWYILLRDGRTKVVGGQRG